MNKLKTILKSIAIFTLTTLPVSAQVNLNDVTNKNLGDNKVNILPISIPFFKNFINFNTNNANLLSWAAFIGALATVGLVIFWIYLIIKAGVKALQSQGNPEGLEEAFKRVRSVLIGASISLFFPAILSLVGVFLGIGTIFQWPKMFEDCNSGDHQYYFQAYLAAPKEKPDADPEVYADSICK